MAASASVSSDCARLAAASASRLPVSAEVWFVGVGARKASQCRCGPTRPRPDLWDDFGACSVRRQLVITTGISASRCVQAVVADTTLMALPGRPSLSPLWQAMRTSIPSQTSPELAKHPLQGMSSVLRSNPTLAEQVGISGSKLKTAVV